MVRISYLLIATLALCLIQLNISSAQATKDYTLQTESLDATLTTLYSVISGEAGVKRDWDLFRNLFYPGGRLIPVRIQNDKQHATLITPEQYIERSGKWLEDNGFHEKEIHRIVEQFGDICHVFSTYASFRSQKDEIPFARGINSIQLFNDGERWWILNIYWQAENDAYSLPDKYLPGN